MSTQPTSYRFPDYRLSVSAIRTKLSWGFRRLILWETHWCGLGCMWIFWRREKGESNSKTLGLCTPDTSFSAVKTNNKKENVSFFSQNKTNVLNTESCLSDDVTYHSCCCLSLFSIHSVIFIHTSKQEVPQSASQNARKSPTVCICVSTV